MTEIINAITMTAPAKINLYLHVTGKRDDGYHLLDSLVAFAGVHDIFCNTVGYIHDRTNHTNYSNNCSNISDHSTSHIHKQIVACSKSDVSGAQIIQDPGFII